MEIPLDILFQGGPLCKQITFVSHRWEDPDFPDMQDVQLCATQAHLRERTEVQWVWYDYMCMPQKIPTATTKDGRTPREKAEFKAMLMAMVDLYLTCSVLI